MSAGVPPPAERFLQWDAWLSRRIEPPLEPQRRFIDAHHHLWDRGGHRYLPDVFRADAGDLPLAASVYVECQAGYRVDGPMQLRPVGETAAVVAMTRPGGTATRTAVAAGIVGYADMTLGDRVEEVLEAHQDAGEGRFKGLRLTVAWDADPSIHSSRATVPGMLRDPRILDAARCVMQRGLTLDLWIYFHQLADVVAFANACPGLSLIINHCGGPLGIGVNAGRRAEVLTEWRAGIAALGGCDRIAMKFGGLAMPLAGFPWRKWPDPPTSEVLATAWQPYFDCCLAAFGAERMMFESNFPVDRTGCTYTSLWNAFSRLSGSLSAAERDALFARTAARLYRLEVPGISCD